MSETESSFAHRMLQMRPSTIREILKVTAEPDVISFAGGLPAPELFPVDAVRDAADLVLEQEEGRRSNMARARGWPGFAIGSPRRCR